MAVLETGNMQPADRDKPVEPAETISSYVLIKNDEESRQLYGGGIKAQQLRDEMLCDIQKLGRVMIKVRNEFYCILMMILPVILGMSIESMMSQITSCPHVLEVTRACVAVSYALTWILALPLFFKQWWELKHLMDDLPQGSNTDKTENGDEEGDKGEVEEVGGDNESGSDDETESSDNNDNAKGDTRDNPAVDEELLVGEISLDKECAAGDQEEPRLPLLESVS